MYNLSFIEKWYQTFSQNLTFWIPDGIYSVDLALLHDLELLSFQPGHRHKVSSSISGFHLIESSDKMTLINDEFIVWIIPKRSLPDPMTYTLIAKTQGEEPPKLEVAFINSGIYNQSKFVFQILEKFLINIKELEKLLSQIK